MKLQNYLGGHWVEGDGAGTPLIHAVSGEVVAQATSDGIDFKAMLDYARRVGGPKLRRLTFHQRALMLKELAKYLGERKDALYALSTATGATKADSWIDIDGGIGTFFVFASKGRRELPNETFFVDGPPSRSRSAGASSAATSASRWKGRGAHQRLQLPRVGDDGEAGAVAAGRRPCIVKPATLTSFLTEAVFRAMIESKIFPEGAIQLICGSAGDLLDHLDCAGLRGVHGIGLHRADAQENQEHRRTMRCASTWKPTRSTAPSWAPTRCPARRSSTSS